MYVPRTGPISKARADVFTPGVSKRPIRSGTERLRLNATDPRSRSAAEAAGWSNERPSAFRIAGEGPPRRPKQGSEKITMPACLQPSEGRFPVSRIRRAGDGRRGGPPQVRRCRSGCRTGNHPGGSRGKRNTTGRVCNREPRPLLNGGSVRQHHLRLPEDHFCQWNSTTRR